MPDQPPCPTCASLRALIDRVATALHDSYGGSAEETRQANAAARRALREAVPWEGQREVPHDEYLRTPEGTGQQDDPRDDHPLEWEYR